LIVVSGFFAASELSLITAKRHRLSQLASEGNRSAQVAERLLEDPLRFLAAIQVALTFLGFLASAGGAVYISVPAADLIRIIALSETKVHEVMVPRIGIRAVEVNDSLDEVLDMVIRAGHSRVPVYEESLDNIVGVLYAKDLLPYLKSDGKSSEAIDVRTLVRPPVYVPETKAVDELLREMQVAKRHIAIVVDEYGGTAGLVTIEDIVEEIVGELQDEYDIEEALVDPT